MANKQALRELQTRLAERMQQVRHETPGVSWLAVDCGGQGLLLALRQAGEISDLGALVPVPHTQPWLAGVVNLRGGVFTVVDLARFLGLRAQAAPPTRDHARLVAFNAALGINGALLVDRLEGLRHAVDMQPEPETTDNDLRPAFAPARWCDAAGRAWQEIDLAALARLPQFLAITG
ncbi:MAG: chemotaxis protein CheW [Burkholderiales bacterium RIFCSPHIGHO2_12_FULL_69_20]|nr:MAG: chemotaxis protein CheW [Burkholderiales bacterium RIFCSPHIGHO2_12_FULL_69_20]